MNCHYNMDIRHEKVSVTCSAMWSDPIRAIDPVSATSTHTRRVTGARTHWTSAFVRAGPVRTRTPPGTSQRADLTPSVFDVHKSLLHWICWQGALLFHVLAHHHVATPFPLAHQGHRVYPRPGIYTQRTLKRVGMKNDMRLIQGKNPQN